MGASFAYSAFIYEPEYSSFMIFKLKDDGDETSAVDGSEIKNTLPQILKSRAFKDRVLDDLEDVTSEQFDACKITLKGEETLDLFSLSVTGPNNEIVYRVLNSSVKNIPAIGRYVFGLISLEHVEESGMATVASNQMGLKTIVMYGLGGGLAVDAIILLIYAFTYETIRREEDLKKNLNVHCLASVPAIRFKRRNREVDHSMHIFNELVPYSFTESIRKISGRIDRDSKKYGRKTILVTSSVPGEGKSTISVNLAMSLAKRDYKVLVIDCDFRNPSTSKVIGFDTSTIPSIMEAVDGHIPVSDIIQHFDEWGLDMIFTGITLDNPMATIYGENFRKFIANIQEMYDYVILDTPPSAMLTDASNFAQFADGIVYVVRYDAVPVKTIREGMSSIALSRKPIYGCVINGVENANIAYNTNYYGKSYDK
ncbi:MAG: polysaccharide biosynthesis tyrosine autokinase [Lachnospiraceae bacterium]|nr:polysaccharide biosynthesis tyrosine autokinase [Lachnospiraceae bacterium]